MGAARNAVPAYTSPDLEVTRHRLLTMPLRTSSLRSLGAFLNVFAIESFMDELAGAAGADPVNSGSRTSATRGPGGSSRRPRPCPDGPGPRERCPW